jgi:hypothetical protein
VDGRVDEVLLRVVHFANERGRGVEHHAAAAAREGLVEGGRRGEVGGEELDVAERLLVRVLGGASRSPHHGEAAVTELPDEDAGDVAARAGHADGNAVEVAVAVGLPLPAPLGSRAVHNGEEEEAEDGEGGTHCAIPGSLKKCVV